MIPNIYLVIPDSPYQITQIFIHMPEPFLYLNFLIIELLFW